MCVESEIHIDGIAVLYTQATLEQLPERARRQRSRWQRNGNWHSTTMRSFDSRYMTTHATVMDQLSPPCERRDSV